MLLLDMVRRLIHRPVDRHEPQRVKRACSYCNKNKTPDYYNGAPCCGGCWFKMRHCGVSEQELKGGQ